MLRELLARRSAKWPVRPCQTQMASCPALSPFLFAPILFGLPRASRLERQGDQFLIACGGSKTVSITVQTPSADCSCGDAGTVGVEIYSISTDDTRGIAVAIFVCGYAFVANRTRRPAVSRRYRC